MKFGPLGFPRLTSAGPLVSDTEEFSQAVEKDDMGDVLLEQAGALGVPRQDPSEEQKQEVIKEVVRKIYPSEGPVARAKRARLATCMGNSWAKNWAKGLGENTGTVDLDDDLEMMTLKFKGCVGITESNVPDDPRLISEEFVMEDEPEPPISPPKDTEVRPEEFERESGAEVPEDVGVR